MQIDQRIQQVRIVRCLLKTAAQRIDGVIATVQARQQQALVVANPGVLRQRHCRGLHPLQRLLGLALLDQQQGEHVRQVAMVSRRHFFQREPFAQHLLGLIQLLRGAEQGNQVDPGGNEIRVQFQGLAILVQRFGIAPLAAQQYCQIEAASGQVGVAAQALLVVSQQGLERLARLGRQLLCRYIGQRPDGFIAHRQGRVLE
ncbi:hypothetical protein D3C76_851020 [compost metagenome]